MLTEYICVEIIHIAVTHNDSVLHTVVQWLVFARTTCIAVVHSNTKEKLNNCGADEGGGGDKLVSRTS